MPNRLAVSTSPYLLQHKDNPVDWWPWCDEAWETAAANELPVFLSVGYSSCHWCHVMAHESFEDSEVANALNAAFVCIKLDREERPDIDEVYMTAVQLASGHGGWPMSVFLTPEKKPFFAATYIPKEPRHGHPGLINVLHSLSKAWNEQREEVVKSSEEFAAALTAALERSLPSGSGVLGVSDLDHAVETLHMEFDTENGGFGGRPKFPPHAAIRFLLDYAQIRPELQGDPGDLPERAGHMALLTLEKIALGGIHDHVGGGFHRYSTDEWWHLPHFEKMLYDNAQLLAAFAHGGQATVDSHLKELFEHASSGITNWLNREVRTPSSMFASALDADSEGEEGAYYVWSMSEIYEVLERRAETFSEAFGCSEAGNFLDEATGVATGVNVLHLTEPTGRFESELGSLRQARSTRPRPGTDHKCLASWNGLAIGALSQSGHTDDALACASAWARLTPLSHMSTDGRAAGLPFLDDLVYLADGYLDLFDSTSDPVWRGHANGLMNMVTTDYSDPSGGFSFTSNKQERLFGRTKPFMDGATPSPNGIAARVFRRLGRFDDSWSVVQAGAGWIRQVSRAADTLLRELLWLLWETHDMDSNVMSVGSLLMPTFSLDPSEPTVDEEGWAYALLVVTIPDGCHINSSEPAAAWLVPTTIEAEGAFAEASFPESASGQYEGRVAIHLRLRPKGAQKEFSVRVRFQLCTESECLAPSETTLYGRLVQP